MFLVATLPLVNILLSWSQYVPHHVQSGKAIFAIKANFILLPIAMIVLSIVVMYFYNLDKIYNQIKMTNKEN